MSKANQRSNETTRAKPGDPARPSIVFPVLIIGILAIGGIIGFWFLKKPSSVPPPDASQQSAAQTPPEQAIPQTPAPSDTPSASISPPISQTPVVPVASEVAPPPAPVPPQPLAPPGQLVASLGQIDLRQPLSAQQAEQWKQSLHQLVQQGSASLPTIQQFLLENHDPTPGAANAASQVGYPSLRAGLIDALAQIGGPDGTAAMLQVLQSSTVPADLPLLAKDIEQQAPGQYQQQFLDAVRQQLSLAVQGGMGDNPQVGPLFDLLAGEAAHGANVMQDLQQYGSKWPYYSTIALASLPDGAGVPSLIQLAQNPEANSTVAAQVLAQVSSQNPQAFNSLLDMAKSGQLSDHAIAQLAPFLAGEQYELAAPGTQPGNGLQTIHMSSGNQDFLAYVPGTGALSQPQINQQVNAIDQLLQSLPSTDEEARNALQQQRGQLMNRR